MNDLRYALRHLRRAPGLSAAAIVTLALGIGATTALFTVVNAVLLQPLPYPDAERLVRLYAAYPEQGADRAGLSVPDFRDWAERTRTVARMGLYTMVPSDLVLQEPDRALEVETAHVSSGFFPTLGVEPALGRPIREADEIGDAMVVVLSHGFWTRQFGADTSVVGRGVTLSDRTFTVIGVMPEGFAFPSAEIEVWAPLTIIPETSIPLQNRGVRFLSAVGRLGPAVTPDQARDDLSLIAADLAREHPDVNAGLTAANVVPLQDAMVGGVRRAVLVLFGAVAFVLLIACVNVTNLLLARGMARDRELAIRAAVGADRRRIVRMLLAESAVLAAAGGIAGSLLAVWGVDLLVARSAGILPRTGEIRPDLWVFTFAFGASLFAIVASGLTPALAAARPDPSERLKRAATHSGSRRGRGTLVAAEVAIALVLLIGAGLLLRSFWSLQQVDPGFRPDRTLAVSLVIPQSRYPGRPEYLAAHREMLDRFRNLPGVDVAGSIRHAPLRSAGEEVSYDNPERPAASFTDRPVADLMQVTPGALRALGVPLLRGRDVEPGDVAGAPTVVVINDTLARLTFPGEDPLGHTIRLGDDFDITVVGVVGDVHQRALDVPPAPTLYVPIEQIPRRAMTFVLRTTGDPLALTGPVYDAVRAVDPGQAITEVSAFGAFVERSVARPRFFTTLLLEFAVLALVLAAIGIYGVVAFTVRQRTREIGIRVALGAGRGRTVRLVLRQGLQPVVTGGAVGLVGALLLTRLMRDLLFAIQPLDVPTYAGVAAVLGGVAFAACWIPGRRAARIDPMEALRHE